MKGYNGLHCFNCGNGYYNYDFTKEEYICVDCEDVLSEREPKPEVNKSHNNQQNKPCGV